MRTPPRRRHCPVVVLARPGSSFTCIVLPGPTWKTPSRTRSLSESDARRPPSRGLRSNAQLRVQTLNSESTVTPSPKGPRRACQCTSTATLMAG
jgi:hypothetical protein